MNDERDTGTKDKIKGKFEQAKGSVKEGFGAATGDRSTEIDGKTDRIKGKVREGYGDAKGELNRDIDHDRK